MRWWPADMEVADFVALRALIKLSEKAHPLALAARPGFIWAGDALRLIAWGQVIYPSPERMLWVEALKQVEEASSRLCDALAAGTMKATGRRGKAATYRMAKLDIEEIPASYFRPGIAIELTSWARMADERVMSDFLLQPDDEAPDWGEVTLRLVDVEKLRQPPPSAAAIRAKEWMVANVTYRGAWKRQAAIIACRAAAKCTDAVAEHAWNELPASVRTTRGAPPKDAG